MRYITITTWELEDGADYDVALRRIEEKRLPALKGFGASRITVVRTSQRTSAVITEWPDQATRAPAALTLDEVRRTVKRAAQTPLTGAMHGAIDSHACPRAAHPARAPAAAAGGAAVALRLRRGAGAHRERSAVARRRRAENPAG